MQFFSYEQAITSQVDWQSSLLCKCINDNINVLGTLQITHLGAKPKLDVLGVTILMLLLMNH
jgi:hypothetical protein